jgi:hypothetical protein
MYAELKIEPFLCWQIYYSHSAMGKGAFLSTLVSAACGTLIGISTVTAVEIFPEHNTVSGAVAFVLSGIAATWIHLKFNRFEMRVRLRKSPLTQNSAPIHGDAPDSEAYPSASQSNQPRLGRQRSLLDISTRAS